MARAVLAGSVAWLAGCGGGGGDGGATTPPPAAEGREQPLAFTADNVGFVAGYALYAPAALLGVAHQVVSGAQRLADERRLALDGDCTTAGSYRLAVADADANGLLSVGDRIDFQFDNCAIDAGSDVYTGVASAVVQAMDATARGALTAELSIGAGGLRLGSAPLGRAFAVLQGGLRLDWRRDLLSARLSVASRAAEDLRRVDGSRIDAWTGVQIDKRVDHAAARIELQLRMRQASDDLGGSFEVRTTAAVRSHLNTLPEASPVQGRFEMTGARGDRVSVPISLPGQPELRADLDAGGDGSIDGTATGTWDGLSAAGLWTDFGAFGRDPAAVGATPFAALVGWQLAGGVPIDEPLRVQFNRVPVDAAGLRVRLVDRGRVDGVGEATEVPVRVRHEGALVLIEPQEPLRYSRLYEVEIDPTPVSGPDLQQAVLPAGSSFVTPDRLRPVVRAPGAPSPSMPPPLAMGEVLRLSAAPSSDPRFIAAYAWSQRDGAPLAIASPSASETELRLLPGSDGIGWATLRLTLTHHDGRQESRDVRIKTVASTPATGWWHRVRVPTGTAGEALTEWAAEGTGLSIGGSLGDGGRSLASSYDEAAVGGNRWLFSLAAPAGETLRPGRYDGAEHALATRVQQGLAPRLDAQVMGRSCLPSLGWFEIFELEQDAEGRLTRLALDLEVSCGGAGAPVTSASLRLNSTRPAPP